MKIEHAAKCMAELGHVKRLSIYKLLVKAGPQGMATGDIGRELNIPGSTLSHHIQRLVAVNLVEQNQEKQFIHCKAKYKKLNELIDYLTDQCCQA